MFCWKIEPAFCSNCDTGLDWDEEKEACLPSLVCAKDAKKCRDGTSVGRDPKNNCEFFPCKCPVKGCSVWSDGCNRCRCDDGELTEKCTDWGCVWEGRQGNFMFFSAYYVPS